jgi:hypothetical protein
MPLTRHLYELDEVVSALQTCLRKGWDRAIFWTWELVVSEETALATKTLRTVWVRWGGGWDPGCLTDPDWVSKTLRVSAAIQRARSLTATDCLTRAAETAWRPTVTPYPRTAAAQARRLKRSAAFVSAIGSAEDLEPREAADWWISLDSVCRQGSRRDAIWLLQAAAPRLSADAIWTALRIAARGGAGPAIDAIQAAVADDPHPVQQICAQANAVLLLCAKGAEEREAMLAAPAPQGLSFMRREWATWDQRVGRRTARLYAIPVEALHAETTRGSLSRRYTNIQDLREPVPLLTEGCAYWQRVCAAAGIVEDPETGTVIFPDDEELEAFYEREFPDDSPDEWSRADQQKSHGQGCAESAVPPPAEPVLREEPVARRTWRMAIGRAAPARAKKVDSLTRQFGQLGITTQRTR